MDFVLGLFSGLLIGFLLILELRLNKWERHFLAHLCYKHLCGGNKTWEKEIKNLVAKLLPIKQRRDLADVQGVEK